MKFDEKRQYVQEERWRARKAGCRSCKKQTSWLILEGGPSLFDMLRSNASTADLNAAMRERGWYCRACIAKKAKTAQREETRVAVQVDQVAIQRQECEKFLEEEAPGGEYREYLMSLPRDEYVNRMMGLISDGMAGDVVEAFLMVKEIEAIGIGE